MVLIDEVSYRDKTDNHQGDEPPTLPDWRYDRKFDRSGLPADNTVRIHRPHQKAITARSEVRIIHSPLICRRIPIPIRAFEHELLLQHVAASKSHTDEFDLQLIPACFEIKTTEMRYA